jgi:hypothetical protein
MEKFHSFLAYTYVTIGQVKGRTLLPLPQADVTNSERTSSKDKAHILESKLIFNKFGIIKFKFSRHYPLAKTNQECLEVGP